MKTPMNADKQFDSEIVTDESWPFPAKREPRKQWAITAFIDGFMNAVDPTRWFRDLDWGTVAVIAFVLFALTGVMVSAIW